jgi:hypothetical protein
VSPPECDDEQVAAQLAMAEVVESIVHGEPFTEKRSTFQAHLAPVVNLQQVGMGRLRIIFIYEMLSDKDVRTG